MKCVTSWIIIVCLAFGLCGCAGKTTGEELFGLPEQAMSYTLRHAGQTRLYFNYAQGDRCAIYQSALRDLKLKPTSKQGAMDRNLYEITTSYTVFNDTNHTVEEFTVELIVNGNMVLYDDQWYEANTSQLLRQLKQDFANE